MDENKFSTLEEVREYLSGKSIECLVCGKSYKRLQHMHLQMHDLDADGYRERFGIPWHLSLTSAPSRQASRDHLSLEWVAQGRQSFKGGPKGPKRPLCPAVRRQWALSSEIGREVNARRRVTVPCSGGCGAQLETTALTAVQPIFCDKCASPLALKQRRRYQAKKRGPVQLPLAA